LSELYFRNKAGNSYADISDNAVRPTDGILEETNYIIHLNKPIFKNKAGKRLMLSENDQINPDKIIRYLNIKVEITIASDSNRNA